MRKGIPGVLAMLFAFVVLFAGCGGGAGGDGEAEDWWVGTWRTDLLEIKEYTPQHSGDGYVAGTTYTVNFSAYEVYELGGEAAVYYLLGADGKIYDDNPVVDNENKTVTYPEAAEGEGRREGELEYHDSTERDPAECWLENYYGTATARFPHLHVYHETFLKLDEARKEIITARFDYDADPATFEETGRLRRVE